MQHAGRERPRHLYSLCEELLNPSYAYRLIMKNQARISGHCPVLPNSPSPRIGDATGSRFIGAVFRAST
jgi:hypothetical protein